MQALIAELQAGSPHKEDQLKRRQSPTATAAAPTSSKAASSKAASSHKGPIAASRRNAVHGSAANRAAAMKQQIEVRAPCYRLVFDALSWLPSPTAARLASISEEPEFDCTAQDLQCILVCSCCCHCLCRPSAAHRVGIGVSNACRISHVIRNTSILSLEHNTLAVNYLSYFWLA